jgi:hypothetical protein
VSGMSFQHSILRCKCCDFSVKLWAYRDCCHHSHSKRPERPDRKGSFERSVLWGSEACRSFREILNNNLSPYSLTKIKQGHHAASGKDGMASSRKGGAKGKATFDGVT